MSQEQLLSVVVETRCTGLETTVIFSQHTRRMENSLAHCASTSRRHEPQSNRESFACRGNPLTLGYHGPGSRNRIM